MFLSLVADLDIHSPSGGGIIPATHGECMQSELFRQLRALDGASATRVHGFGDTGSRSYTISPVWFTQAPSVRRGLLHVSKPPGLPLHPDAPDAWFRLTAFEPGTAQALLRLAQTTRQWTLTARPHTLSFQIRRWHVQSSNWSGRDELSSLWGRAGTDNRIVLRFYSPTTFSATGDEGWAEHLPLPLPERIFGSLYERLAAAWPELPLPVWHPSPMLRQIALGRFQIASNMLHFARRNRHVPGFTGQCEFVLSGRMAPLEKRYLNFLADAAFYLGVGRMTSWGMGQVRRVAEWDAGEEDGRANGGAEWQ